MPTLQYVNHVMHTLQYVNHVMPTLQYVIHVMPTLQPERITHGQSFLVSDLSDSPTLLIFGEQPQRFTHMAHQKRGNERLAHFFNTFCFKL